MWLFKLFIVESTRNLSNKVKNHLFRDTYLCELISVFWYEELMLEICPRILDTSCIHVVDSIIGLHTKNKIVSIPHTTKLIKSYAIGKYENHWVIMAWAFKKIGLSHI
jgi:hypothetical protein